MNTNNLINKAILCSLAMAGAALLPSCVSPATIRIMESKGFKAGKIKASANLAAALRSVRDADPKDLLTVASSLARLAALEGNYAVYPGHGDVTNLDAERRQNPAFMA